MRIFIGLVFLAAGTGWSQTTTPFQCTASAGTAPIVRAEGVTELVGDVVLTCTGGTPAPKGQAVPPITLTANLNTSVTSRLLANGGSEALLLIDEPNGASHPLTPQLACPNLSGCSMTGTGGAANEYNGSPVYNVYQAIQRGPNSISWLGVPLDPPGSAGSRILRITNVRANANQLAVGNSLPPPIFLAVSLSAGLSPAIQPQTVATIQPGLTVGTAPSSSQECSSPAAFNLTVTEGFAGAFKQQNAGTVANVPGQSHPTVESGFVPVTSAGLPAGTGAADMGTTFQVTVANLSAGMTVQVPSTNQLMASGGAVGTATTSGGTVVGSNVQFLPAQGSTSVQFFVEIVQVNAATSIKKLTLPMMLLWSSQTVPANLTATAGFLDAPSPQTTLFAPFPNVKIPNYPIWQPLDTGIVGTPSPYLTVASIVNCSSTISTLTAGTNSPTFSGYSNIVVPASYNYGIVSSGPPISNITASTNASWLSVTLNQTTTPATATFIATPPPIAGNYSTNVTINSPAGSLTVPVTINVIASPWFIRYAFGNVASYVSDAVAPGEMFILYGGNNFGPSPLAFASLDANGRLAGMIAGTKVLFDGQAAPLYYAVDASGVGQVTGFVPFEVAGEAQTQVQVVSSNGATSPPVALPVLPAVPGLFTSDTSGGGPGAILNQDQSVNSPANPDSVGNVITLYGTGAGQTSPAGRDGAFAGVGGTLAVLGQPVKVFIDGILATNVTYTGSAPQEVEGLFQIDVQIPPNVHHPGDLSVVVQIGEEMTQPGVTVSVK